MTPKEIQEAARALRKEIGQKCELTVYIGTQAHDDAPVWAHCRPRGYGNDNPALTAKGDDWKAVLDDIRAQWNEVAADIAKEVTRRMALAIIRITADLGQCTNAALRADEFTEAEIKALGAAACRMADEMASNGPFRITAVAGANAA